MVHKEKNPLKTKVLYGMLVLIIREFGIKLISILGQLILIEIIAPEYFGIYAVFAFILNLANLLSDFGLAQAIIQKRDKVTSEQLGTIIGLKLLFSLFIFVLLLLCVPFLRIFYKQLDSQNIYMFVLLGATLFPSSLKNVLIAFFDRKLDFSLVSKIDFIGILAYFVTAIVLGVEKFYLWNFIYALFVKEFIEFIMAAYYNRNKFSFSFRLESIKRMMKYGSFLQLGSIVAFIENSIVPIVGFSLSSYNLGLLDWSFNVTNLSSTIFENYGRAAFAGMSRIQNKKNSLSLAVNKSTSLLNAFAFLFILMVLGFSKDFILLFLPQRWIPALPALYWFSSSLVFFGGAISIAHALMAMGKSKEITIFTSINMVIEISLAFILVKQIGPTGISIAFFTGYLIQLCGYLVLGKKEGLKLEIKKPYSEKLVIFFLSGFIFLLLNHFKLSLLSFLIKVSITGFTYGILFFIFSKDEVSEVFRSIFSNKIK